MTNKAEAAAHWWSDALQRYEKLRADASAAGVECCHLPVIEPQRIHAFNQALTQQLQKTIAESDDNGCQALLFVNGDLACEELTQAARTAGIDKVTQLMPDRALMRIYEDEVFVTRGDIAAPETLEFVWMAQTDSSRANANDASANTEWALQTLADHLGTSKKSLRSMVQAGQIKLKSADSGQAGLEFVCGNIKFHLDAAQSTRPTSTN